MTLRKLGIAIYGLLFVAAIVFVCYSSVVKPTHILGFPAVHTGWIILLVIAVVVGILERKLFSEVERRRMRPWIFVAFFLGAALPLAAIGMPALYKDSGVVGIVNVLLLVCAGAIVMIAITRRAN